MSVARVTTVTKSMKPVTCDKCRDELPKGSAYRHYKIGFRSRHVYKRCMKPECTPRSSELESSLLSGVYAAQEDAEDALDAGGFESLEEIEAILTDCANAINEVAQQYSDAADAMGEGAGFDMQERAELLESSASDLEGTDLTVSDEDCTECNGTGFANACTTCEGSGKVDDADCPDCDGDPTGGPCEDCDGEGTKPNLEDAVEAARAAINDMEMP